jgi:hypothetical protein
MKWYMLPEMKEGICSSRSGSAALLHRGAYCDSMAPEYEHEMFKPDASRSVTAKPAAFK